MFEPNDILRTTFTADDIPEMLSFIRDENNQYHHRHDMIIALGKMKKDAVSALINLLDAKFAGIRQSAVEALGAMGKEAVGAYSALENAMKDMDAEVRRAVVKALGKMGPKALTILMKAMDDASPEVRKSALVALEKMRPMDVPNINPNSIKVIIDLEEIKPEQFPELLHPKQRPRTYFELEGDFKIWIRNTPDAVSKIIENLAECPYWKVKLIMIEALEKMGPKAKAAVPIILNELKRETMPEIRGALIAALGAIDSDELTKYNIPPLIAVENAFIKKNTPELQKPETQSPAASDSKSAISAPVIDEVPAKPENTDKNHKDTHTEVLISYTVLIYFMMIILAVGGKWLANKFANHGISFYRLTPDLMVMLLVAVSILVVSLFLLWFLNKREKKSRSDN